MSKGQAPGVQPQAQAPQDGAVQPAHVPPAVALGPGRGNSLLDYSNTPHIKTYYKVVTQLEHKFDSKPSTLRIFMKSIANQAKCFGWDNILNIVDFSWEYNEFALRLRTTYRRRSKDACTKPMN